ncbi:MAG: hypothetical protein R6W90_02405 [Ignavibacteriaceae bacterium]
MQKDLRQKFNQEFTEEKYNNFLRAINTSTFYPADFRISETPLFLTKEFTDEIIKASYNIAEQLQTEEFKKKSNEAIPAGLIVPNETEHPVFLQIDFAVCKDKNGTYIPKLIELQGFPSLYCFQYYLNRIVRESYNIPENITTYFNGLDDQSYINILKNSIMGEFTPENVILLEIEPEKQKTRIDFACTGDLLGIKPVCVTKIIKKSNRLFYNNKGKEIPIKRIYNRVIFDELEKKKDIQMKFKFTDDLNVQWAGHPNWYFKISKHSLPSLKGEYVPQCFFLDELENYPVDLSNYVLKPLYSFAGMGVEVDVTGEMLDKIKDRRDYILQKKIEYTPLIETPDGFAKAEIRMMFIWQEKPMLVNNLVRMSKGKMMGVAFNKDKTWVGSSLAYHP